MKKRPIKLGFQNFRLQPEPTAVTTDNLWRSNQVVALVAGKPEKVSLTGSPIV